MIMDEAGIRSSISDVLGITAEEMKCIRSDEDLRNSGLNSLTSIELIVRLENEWEISIEDEDLLIDNMSTVNKIIQLLGKYVCDKSA